MSEHEMTVCVSLTEVLRERTSEEKNGLGAKCSDITKLSLASSSWN